MKIEHIAIWTKDLELLKDFYVKYFHMNCNKKYINAEKQFSSYFLSFNKGNCRIELMHNPKIAKQIETNMPSIGLHHFAISVGNNKMVDEITSLLKKDGFTIKSGPRTTGDGYYESLIIDPDGNRVEITV